MKIYWKNRKTVVDMPYMTQAAVPAIKLAVYHAPQQRVEVMLDGRFPFLVPLVELDWSHESLAKLNRDERHLREIDIVQTWDANGTYTPERTGK